MKYLIVLLMCVLATTKVSIQTSFGKTRIKTASDSLFFNAMIFSLSAILFINSVAGAPCPVWAYALPFGFLTVIFQLTYTIALANGSVSLTVMLVNFSMIIPVTISYVVYGEKLTISKIIAILIIITVFVLTTDLKNVQGGKKAYVYAIVAMFANGALAVVQKIFGASSFAKYSSAYVSCSYICASFVAFLIYFITKKISGTKTFKVNKKTVLYVLGVGAALAIFQRVNIHAIANIDGVFLFPVYSGGSIILSSLSGIFLFGDRLTNKLKLSLAMGIIAIILMNF